MDFPATLRVLMCLILSGLLAGCTQLRQPDPATGTRLVNIESPDGVRNYWLHVPDVNFDEPRPLLVALHGTGGNGQRLLAIGDFADHAQEETYIIAAPNSLGRAFNEGSGRIGKEYMHVDDVAFIERVIQDVSGDLPIDPDRVFVTGFSSGGAMTQRFALETDVPVTALASVSGHLWAPEREPRIPRPLLLMFGDSDPLNPVDGGPVRYGPELVLDKPSHRETEERWAKRLQCVIRDDADMSLMTQHVWQACDEGAELILLTVPDLGHFWPGGPIKSYDSIPAERVGPYQGKVDATSVIWDFFQQSVR